MRSTSYSTIRNSGKFSATVFRFMTRFMTGLLLCMVLLPTVAHAALGDTAETIDRRGTFRGPVAAPDTPYARLPARSLWLERTLFNMTASFLGMPGLASPVDGLSDEGLGLHADGTTRRAGGADSASGFGGQRAASYMRSGQYGANTFHQPWLYDDLMGYQRGPDGRLLRPGSEYSGRRGQYGGGGYGQFGSGMGSMGDSFAHSLLQRGISAGMGLANTAAESAILGLMGSGSPYGNGKARLNFNLYVDDKGNSRFGGEGDVLWPLYDNPYTTIYTQFGARSMYGGGSKYGPDRWIGNWGVGQRWFPGAKMGEDGKSVDSGNWMVGYNAFFDYDITRGHQRGGLGVEAQYDWLKLASNWYFPMSDWKDSKDFDGRFVQERAAQGWDLRAKGYLPFYREIAITGSYTQWYGDHVGMFGPSKLEKNPKVWSYGIEYTPVPALTAFVNQRQTERGRADTEFGLRFTYHFGMDAESQFKPSRVAQMRTVHGSRHDFVDRENKIILEYKAKNRFHIEYLAGMSNPGAGIFVFRLRNGLGEFPAGATVRVSGNNVTTLAEAQRSFFAQALETLSDLLVSTAHAANLSHGYMTDGRGMFTVRTTGFTNASSLTIQAGDTSQTFTAAQLGGGGSSYTFDLSALTVDTSGALGGTIKVTNTSDGTDAAGVAVTLAYRTAGGLSGTAQSTDISLGSTNASGQVTVSSNVSALVRNIQFSANGYSTSVTRPVGTVPTGFLTGQSLINMNWAAAATYCTSHGGKVPRINDSDSWDGTGSNVPVEGFGTIGGSWPIGLPGGIYWTGTTYSDYTDNAWIVNDNGGLVNANNGIKTYDDRVACVP